MNEHDRGWVAGRPPGPWGVDDDSLPPVDLATGPLPAHWNEIHHYKNPTRKKLQCCFFWTSNTTTGNAPAYTDAAQKLLLEHNLALAVCAGVEKTADRTLPFNELINTSHEQTLWDQAQALHPHLDHVPVIFCRFAGPMGGESDTAGYVTRLESRGTLILINNDSTSIDQVTLLHEIGHAADCAHEHAGAGAAFPNFMDYPPPARTGILRNQVIKLAAASFAKAA